ncbi:MAG TPA: leucine-rich repeat domain-containing protein [Enhygromyxa sp.]|nr:leucine-rich repeat domain-containing protein [Enhygromyxa sp.]
MSQHDEADLAAIRVLQQLVEREGVEFVSSRGVSTLASAASTFLLRQVGNRERGAAFAAWLIDQVEVRDLYFDDDQLDALLGEVWDAQGQRGASPTVEARRADLEALLCDAPDDLEHRLVYGDWLSAHHDPFGELIARQIAAASEPDDPTLAHAAAEYLRERADALFGPLAEYLGSVVRPQWHGGFIEAATLGKPIDDPGPYEGAILLRWLLDHRAALLLRELELHPFDRHWGRDQFRALLAVVFERPRPLLRRLTVGVDGDSGDAGELARLDELLPGLEVLELRVRSASIERLRHPTLRRLVWDSQLGPRQTAALAGFELPALRSLRIPGSSDVDWLVHGSWRAGLEHLDLSGGGLQDHDARLLARQPWPRLRRLDVSNNLLGPEGIALLASLCPELVSGEQQPADDWDDPLADDDDDDEYYDSVME